MKKYVSLLITYRKLNLQSVIAYKKSFLIAAFSMFINDILMIWVFYMFFSKFGTIGGMSWEGYLKLTVVIIWVYCFMNVGFYGVRNISERIVNGQLDADMLLPKNLLFKLLINGINTTVFGDVIYGLVILFFLPHMSVIFILKLFVVSLLGGLVYIGFTLTVESLGFRLGSSRELSRAMFEAILGPSHYPQGIFPSIFFKVLFMSLIPVFFVTYLPYNMVAGAFTWQNLLLLMGAAIIFMGLGVFVFYRGLKRYESGNMVQVNV